MEKMTRRAFGPMPEEIKEEIVEKLGEDRFWVIESKWGDLNLEDKDSVRKARSEMKEYCLSPRARAEIILRLKALGYYLE